jgi:hypothetical protein
MVDFTGTMSFFLYLRMMLVTGESYSLNFTHPPTVVSQHHLYFDRQSSQIDIKMTTLREGWGAKMWFSIREVFYYIFLQSCSCPSWGIQAMKPRQTNNIFGYKELDQTLVP